MLDNIVIPVLEREDVVIRDDKIEEGLSLQKYFDFELVEWEIFLFALIVGVETTDGFIFFDDIRIIIGRGAGKNGFISFLCFYFLSPYHGIKGYNIDIIANSENQAKTSFKDVYQIIKEPKEEYRKTLEYYYHATGEIIFGKATNSELRYNTSSKRGKDSKRTGCIIEDEKHEYLDDTNINTLQSGLGKVKNARVISITTDGHVRGGVLDKEKDQNRDILKEYDPENRTLVFWCRIEAEEEWKDINKVVKANPSIPYMPNLKRQIQKEIREMPFKMDYFSEFITKRCNYPIGDKEKEVATWDDIMATNQEMVDLEGLSCIGGIDYAKTNDFVACVLVFKKNGKVYVIHHSFICKKSRDLPGIKAPLEDWAKKGDCEFVDDVEIPPEKVAEWFAEKQQFYDIKKIAIDNFRYSILNRALKNIGFDAAEKKNVVLTHKWDIVKAAPVINSLFITHSLVYGDVAMMRWYTNNAKKVEKGGNITYDKIEPNYRKTDGYMAFVAAMTLNEEMPENEDEVMDFDIYTY